MAESYQVFAPLRSKFFPFRVSTFWQDFVIQNHIQAAQKVVYLCKRAGKHGGVLIQFQYSGSNLE